MSEIQWRKIDYPGIRKNLYMISENGEVMNIITGHKLTPFTDKDGYLKYSLCGDKTRTSNAFAHRLVATAFIPNPYKLPVVDHIDGKKQHNHYTNLEWVTVRENTLRAENMGLRTVRGEANGNSRWSEEFVRSICEKFQDNWSIKDVYKWAKKDPNAVYTENDPLYTLIYRLKKKELWPDVVCDYDYTTQSKRENWKNPIPQTSNYKYSEDEIRTVCQYLQEGKTPLDIVEIMIGIRSTTDPYYDFVQGIRTRKNWTYISKDYDFSKLKTDRSNGCSKEIADMIDSGMNKKDIRLHYGILDKESTEARTIGLMIDRYHKAKRLGRNITIYETEESN